MTQNKFVMKIVIVNNIYMLKLRKIMGNGILFLKCWCEIVFLSEKLKNLENLMGLRL